MAPSRRRFVFRGHVQGVGFRASTSWIARGFDVVGYVRNLPDGAVEVVAEGPDAELQAFLQAILGELGGHVRGHDVQDLAGEGPEYSGFVIRY